ncbi:MAG: amidohydrolase [Gemmatimonadaceae bacterium]
MVRYHARWLVPVSSPPVEHGTVAVAEGRIVYVGPRAQAPRGPDRDLGDAILLPGLVNAHTHLELTGMRGFLEGNDFAEWIRVLTAGRRAVLDDAALLDAARLGVIEGLGAGVTTFADTGSSTAAFEAMRELGVRGVAYQEVFGPDPDQCPGAMAGLRATIERLRPRETPLVRVGVSPHAAYSVSDALFEAVGRYGRDESLPLAIHAAESEEEQRYVTAAAGPFADLLHARGIAVAPRGRSPIALLSRTGVLDARSLLIHCLRTDAADVAVIARHGCAIAHCPASNAKLGHGIAPLNHWMAAGIRVGIGSDSVVSNNRMDLLDEARVAILLSRVRSGGATHPLGAVDAIAIATLGGARALGLDAHIGSLDVGKEADLAAFPLSDARSIPVRDPRDALVFAVAGRAASFVAVAGEARVLDGIVLRADRALTRRVTDSARKLDEWRGSDR